MLNIMDSVLSHCSDLDPRLVETHFQRLPAPYFERYSSADISRHLRLLSGMSREHPVEVEVRPLASQAYEMLVVGIDHSGTVACVTAALAAYGLNLEDVQVATYFASPTEPGKPPEPNFFIIVLRMSGTLQGRSVAGFAGELRDRLVVAFSYLAQGNLLEAQTVVSDVNQNLTEVGKLTPSKPMPPPAAPSSGFDGLVLGNDFRLQHKLSSGGMAEVYLANQTSLNRTVAVKLIRHEGAADDDVLARFYKEGLVLGKFTCPYIVQIFAAGTVPGRAGGLMGWMAMEFMAGGDLAGWQRQHGCPSVELAIRWFREALEGLQYAHRHSILHRDLKPHNLLLTSEGHLKVSDFGLLKNAEHPNADLTPRSAIVGTPHYMSPEQALGESVDERSDIFSLGTTFFYLLSGRLPFQKGSTTATLVQITQEDAPKLTEVAPQVPVFLSVIISRMMARRLEERYQDVGVILEDLASYERRGILKHQDSGSLFIPPQLNWGTVGQETQAYRPPSAAE